jgi:hypothetical protein
MSFFTVCGVEVHIFRHISQSSDEVPATWLSTTYSTQSSFCFFLSVCLLKHAPIFQWSFCNSAMPLYVPVLYIYEALINFYLFQKFNMHEESLGRLDLCGVCIPMTSSNFISLISSQLYHGHELAV